MKVSVEQFGKTNNGVVVTVGSVDLYFSYRTSGGLSRCRGRTGCLQESVEPSDRKAFERD